MYSRMYYMIKVTSQFSVEKMGFSNIWCCEKWVGYRKILNWITLLHCTQRYSTNVPMIKCKPRYKKVIVQEENFSAFLYNYGIEKAFLNQFSKCIHQDKKKVDKADYIKVEKFYMAKDTRSKSKIK